MSLSWVTHPGKRRENTAWEETWVREDLSGENWLISTQQLGWEKLMLWLTAPVLQGWRAMVALEIPVLDPHLILPRTERAKANGLKGKWPAEKAKQPQTIKGPKPALFLTEFPHCRGIGAEVLGLREVSHHSQTHRWSLAASPSWIISIRKHHPSDTSPHRAALCTALAHPIWVERCWGDAASTAQHWLKLKPCSTLPGLGDVCTWSCWNHG